MPLLIFDSQEVNTYSEACQRCPASDWGTKRGGGGGEGGAGQRDGLRIYRQEAPNKRPSVKLPIAEKSWKSSAAGDIVLMIQNATVDAGWYRAG